LKLNHPSQVTHRNYTASRPNWSGPALCSFIVSIFSHSFTITALEMLMIFKNGIMAKTHARMDTHSYTLIHTQTHTGHSNTHPHIHILYTQQQVTNKPHSHTPASVESGTWLD
jgi:hypothetical protein